MFSPGVHARWEIRTSNCPVCETLFFFLFQLNGYRFSTVLILILPYMCWKRRWPKPELSVKHGEATRVHTHHVWLFSGRKNRIDLAGFSLWQDQMENWFAHYLTHPSIHTRAYTHTHTHTHTYTQGDWPGTQFVSLCVSCWPFVWVLYSAADTVLLVLYEMKIQSQNCAEKARMNQSPVGLGSGQGRTWSCHARTRTRTICARNKMLIRCETPHFPVLFRAVFHNLISSLFTTHSVVLFRHGVVVLLRVGHVELQPVSLRVGGIHQHWKLRKYFKVGSWWQTLFFVRFFPNQVYKSCLDVFKDAQVIASTTLRTRLTKSTALIRRISASPMQTRQILHSSPKMFVWSECMGWQARSLCKQVRGRWALRSYIQGLPHVSTTFHAVCVAVMRVFCWIKLLISGSERSAWRRSRRAWCRADWSGGRGCSPRCSAPSESSASTRSTSSSQRTTTTAGMEISFVLVAATTLRQGTCPGAAVLGWGSLLVFMSTSSRVTRRRSTRSTSRVWFWQCWLPSHALVRSSVSSSCHSLKNQNTGVPGLALSVDRLKLTPWSNQYQLANISIWKMSWNQGHRTETKNLCVSTAERWGSSSWTTARTPSAFSWNRHLQLPSAGPEGRRLFLLGVSDRSSSGVPPRLAHWRLDAAGQHQRLGFVCDALLLCCAVHNFVVASTLLRLRFCDQFIVQYLFGVFLFHSVGSFGRHSRTSWSVCGGLRSCADCCVKFSGPCVRLRCW